MTSKLGTGLNGLLAGEGDFTGCVRALGGDLTSPYGEAVWDGGRRRLGLAPGRGVRLATERHSC